MRSHTGAVSLKWLTGGLSMDKAGTHSAQGREALAALLVQQLILSLAGLGSQSYAFRLILAEPQASLR